MWLFFSTCKPVGNQGALVEPKEFFTVMEVAFSPASPLAGNTRYIAFLLSHNLWQTYMQRHYIHFFLPGFDKVLSNVFRELLP